jgi:hypothetical protein
MQELQRQIGDGTRPDQNRWYPRKDQVNRYYGQVAPMLGRTLAQNRGAKNSAQAGNLALLEGSLR